MTSDNLEKTYKIKELILFSLLLIVIVGFFLMAWASQKTINEYKKGYNQCIEKINQYNQGYDDVWNRPIINMSEVDLNVTRNI